MSSTDQEIIPTEVNQCFDIGDQVFSKISSSLDKRVRNLDKRRTKLLLLEDECQQGKALNEDQKISLKKIPVIDGNIEMAKEVVGIIKESSVEFSSNRAKFVTKKPHPKKEEPAPKPPNLTHTFSQLIQFHAVLASFAKIDTYEKTLKDYAELKLSEDELAHLRAFVELTLLVDYPSLVSLHTNIPDVSNYFSLLVESSKECFQDKFSYSRLHKLLLRVISSNHSLKRLDDMLMEAIDLEDSEFAQEDALPLPLPLPIPIPDPPKQKPTAAPEVAPPPVQELIPSQTILNQSAEPLTEEIFISSTTRLANTIPDNELIMTTVFVPSKVDHEPERLSKPRVLTPETTHIDPAPLMTADKVYPDPAPEAIPTQVITFPSIDLSNISIEDDFDFLHDSELPSVPVKQSVKTKPFPTSTQKPIQSSLFGPAEGYGAGSSFMGARLPDSSYKTRPNLDMYPSSRQQATTSAHTSNYPGVQLDPDMMRYEQKDHYTRNNQTDIQRPPQQIATSSLAQPFGGIVIDNSDAAGRVENAWHSRK
eukprot:TRINITY_DN8158_c1_g2_i1.p1 TRINITY_DN8158_c1_g2~~TRINITY_DN8158_c1_g2_i1.p1  ORF type:complete len:535 (+),score=144.56 TRINITY_DN8158_c1_g2_i1:68-1672(+)